MKSTSTLFRRLQRAFPFIGTRAATETDLYEFLAGEQVEVLHHRNVRKGIYAVGQGCDGTVHVICLNANLTGWSLCYVLAHEIGHYLFHSPKRVRHEMQFPFECRKDHREAELAAAMLLLPDAELKAAVEAGAHRRDDDLGKLVKLRLETFH